MVRRAVALVALSILVSGCQAISRSGTEVLSVAPVQDEPRSLLVLYGGCSSDVRVDVEETPETIRLRVAPSDGGCDAIQGTRIELDAPLGDRDVVDELVAERVPVESEP